MEKRNLILAVDGGGCSSQVALYASDDATEGLPSVVMRMETGPLSLKSSDPATVRASLDELRASTGELERCISIAVLGLSGLDTKEDLDEMIALLGRCGFVDGNAEDERHGYACSLRSTCGYPIVLCSDAILPLFACGLDQGAVLIAGTGSVALRIYPDGNVRRLGGWGYRVSDEGSGYWVGSQFMSEALHVAETILAASPERDSLMRMPPIMHDAWLATVGLDNGSTVMPNVRIAASDLCLWAMGHDDPKDYARLATFALGSNAPEAALLVNRTAAALGRLAMLVCRDCPTLVLSGGLFNSPRLDAALRRAIEATSPSPISMLRPALPLTYGGYELGMMFLRRRLNP